MKKFLIDTDVLIAHLRGNSKGLLSAAFVNESYVSYYTVGELLQGVRNRREMRSIEEFLQEFSIHWGSEAVHKKAIGLLKKYALTDGLHMSDAIIAATAQEMRVQLITLNEKHFRNIREIHVSKDWH
jgi:predicted nucleic acid-binding protein